MKDVQLLLMVRWGASSIITKDGNLMICGAGDTEIINVLESKTEDGFEVPFGIECSVLINATTVMVLGRHVDWSHSKSTYFINLETLQVTDGPEMQEDRYEFGCAVFEHNQQSFVIAAGGHYHVRNTTEVLNLNSKILRWSRGKTNFKVLI